MGYGYAQLGPFMGEIVEKRGDLRILEFWAEIKDWRHTGPGGKDIKPFDQPPAGEIAAYFEEF